MDHDVLPSNRTIRWTEFGLALRCAVMNDVTFGHLNWEFGFFGPSRVLNLIRVEPNPIRVDAEDRLEHVDFQEYSVLTFKRKCGFSGAGFRGKRRGRNRNLAFVLIAFGCLLSALDLHARPEKLVAVMVGSSAYHGTEGLPDLEYSTRDALRLWSLVRSFNNLLDEYLLLDTKQLSKEERLELAGIEWLEPTRENLQYVLKKVEENIVSARREDPSARIRLLFFISSHGDQDGVHLQGGRFSGEALAAMLEAIDADETLVIADACYSGTWLKGSPQGKHQNKKVSLDALSAALRTQRRTATIAALSQMSEDRSFIKGGLMTHIVTSAMIGGADLKPDGKITYDEFRTFTNRYLSRVRSNEEIRIRSPQTEGSRSAVILDLSQYRQQGIIFPKRNEAKARLTVDPSDTDCFIVKDSYDRVRGESCKPAWEERKFYLPSGRYTVLMYTREKNATVHKVPVSVSGSFVDMGRFQGHAGRFASNSSKGGDATSRSDPGALKRLSAEEEQYISRTPFQRAATWRHLPSSHRLGVMLEASAPFDHGPVARTEWEREVSAGQERPFFQLLFSSTHRLFRPRGAYFIGLIEAGAGLSFGNYTAFKVNEGNEVHDSTTLIGLRARTGLGVEVSRAQWTLGWTLTLGGMGTAPIDILSDLDAAYYRALSPTMESRLHVAIEWLPSRWWFMTFGPGIAFEPQRVEKIIFVPYPYVGIASGFQW